MGKNRGKSVNISGKPKHSSDASRTKGSRTAATVRRLKMYNKKPKRDRKGKILKHEFQSKELPSTHIQPDPRWYPNLSFHGSASGNTRVVSQKELELLRDQLQNQNHISNATQVIYVQKGSAKAYATKKVQV